ncbi:MAG: Penicillin-binding protein 2 [Alphaproteobacteria bacterium MarineAlpha9_Bin4]|nr:MAG: Penicillin-binding protein 2 [Alphaproteobacteria bacterium MarineAlpha9_Bin4]|tara:strand:+ start:411 stop:2204 length:1794 start_codon:yes stop_codon:yes gene_type:complete
MLKPRKYYYNVFNRRLFLVGSLKLLAYSIVIERLYNLQIKQSDKYKKLADNNRINLSFIIPSRGLILDRNFNVLADNQEQYQLIFKSYNLENKETALNKIFNYIELTDLKKEDLHKQVIENKKRVLVKQNMKWSEVAKISSNITELEGVYIEMVMVRKYVSLASSHVVGYVGSPEKEDNLKLSKIEGASIGKLAVEASYDNKLQGKFGFKKEEVNAHGRVVNEISRVNGIPGNDINLSISKDLQDFCYNRLESKAGSIVILDITSGEVLALVSRPSFNSNDFIGEMHPEKWNDIINDRLNPLFNRAIKGTYPPGSIFKLIVALAAFRVKDYNPNKRYFCNGSYKFGNQIFHCWNDKGHGFVNCSQALEVSCDCFFYDLSLKVGIDNINYIARKFGFGESYLNETFNSARGIVPNKSWKLKRYGRAWTKTDTIVTSIGQGFALASPLQLAVMVSRIASNGKNIIPTLIKKSSNSFNEMSEIEDLNKDGINLLKGAMFDVVNSPSGTAFQSRLSSNKLMCGKTATSQVRRISMKEREEGIIKNEDLPRSQRDHALFTGYYPHINPKYGFSIVVEHGGSGSKSAAPIAKDLCYKLKLSNT